MVFESTNSGVHLNLNKVRQNSNIEVTYDGLLSRCGAQEVYIHYGSSYLKDWTDIKDKKMCKNSNGTFSANLTVSPGSTFHLCFHDNAYNWDNNSTQNYSYKIH